MLIFVIRKKRNIYISGPLFFQVINRDRDPTVLPSRVDSQVPLMHHDPRDIGFICLVKKSKIPFQILSDLRI